MGATNTVPEQTKQKTGFDSVFRSKKWTGLALKLAYWLYFFFPKWIYTCQTVVI